MLQVLVHPLLPRRKLAKPLWQRKQRLPLPVLLAKAPLPPLPLVPRPPSPPPPERVQLPPRLPVLLLPPQSQPVQAVLLQLRPVLPMHRVSESHTEHTVLPRCKWLIPGTHLLG